MTRVYAISNQKGGVGKTTTAVNLAAALALEDKSVLLIDLDPQGNASSGLGVPKSEAKHGIADVLLGFRELGDVLMATPVDGLHLAPATRELVGVEVELAHTSIRFGFGRFNTEAEVDEALALIVEKVRFLREMSPLYEMVKEGIDLKSIQWEAH